MYINLLYLSLFNCAYLFFLSFLSFLSSQHTCQFCYHCLFPNWPLSLVLLSSLCFSQFCSGRNNFWFPLFTASIYCTLFLLDSFILLMGICVYVHIHSHFLLLLQSSASMLGFCSSVKFFFSLKKLFLNLLLLFYIYSFVCFPYHSFPLAVNL